MPFCQTTINKNNAKHSGKNNRYPGQQVDVYVTNQVIEMVAKKGDD